MISFICKGEKIGIFLGLLLWKWISWQLNVSLIIVMLV